MKKIGNILLSLTLSLLLSLSVFAAGEGVAAVEVEGKERVPVTSSVCDRDEDTDLSVIFDKAADTEVKFGFEEGEEKVVNIYTSLSGKAVCDTFAVMVGGESGTVVAINVYGTNDSTLSDWYRFKVINPAVEEDGFKVFDLKEFVRKFAYYRFEFTLLSGEYFTLSELALYCDEGEAVLTVYSSDGEVEAGSVPSSIDIPLTKKPSKPAIPLFDPFGVRFK